MSRLPKPSPGSSSCKGVHRAALAGDVASPRGRCRTGGPFPRRSTRVRNGAPRPPIPPRGSSHRFSAVPEQGGGAPSSGPVYRAGDAQTPPSSGGVRPAIAESAGPPRGCWRPTWPPARRIGFMGPGRPLPFPGRLPRKRAPRRPPITGSSGPEKRPKNGHFWTPAAQSPGGVGGLRPLT